MYRHHEESIRKLIAYFEADRDVVAVILGGSIAKGLERPDSDVDAMVVVTPQKLAALRAEGRGAECIIGECTYPEGYFDIKYFDREFLEAAALRGSEPARNAFLGARCLFTRDSEIPGIVERIAVFQKCEKADKMLSFYAALSLNMGYLWRSSAGNRYLRSRAAVEVVFFGLRLLLEDAEVLFPCHKSLSDTVNRLERKPLGIVEKGDRLLERMDDAGKEEFCRSVLEFISYRPPEDYKLVLTRFVEDHEQWWYRTRPVIAEW